jgi:hypothetical protein
MTTTMTKTRSGRRSSSALQHTRPSTAYLRQHHLRNILLRWEHAEVPHDCRYLPASITPTQLVTQRR